MGTNREAKVLLNLSQMKECSIHIALQSFMACRSEEDVRRPIA